MSFRVTPLLRQPVCSRWPLLPPSSTEAPHPVRKECTRAAQTCHNVPDVHQGSLAVTIIRIAFEDDMRPQTAQDFRKALKIYRVLLQVQQKATHHVDPKRVRALGLEDDCVPALKLLLFNARHPQSTRTQMSFEAESIRGHKSFIGYCVSNIFLRAVTGRILQPRCVGLLRCYAAPSFPWSLKTIDDHGLSNQVVFKSLTGQF